MTNKGKQTDAPSVAKALEVNKAINEVAETGLRKLLPWKHVMTLFRGESFTSAEAVEFEKGFVKTYPHFVSCSQDVKVAHTQANNNQKPARPIKVIWHVMESSGGRDIMGLSVTAEKEILFPPGTKFTILGNAEKTTKRRGRAAADHMELTVKVEAPEGF